MYMFYLLSIVGSLTINVCLFYLLSIVGSLTINVCLLSLGVGSGKTATVTRDYPSFAANKVSIPINRPIGASAGPVLGPMLPASNQ